MPECAHAGSQCDTPARGRRRTTQGCCVVKAQTLSRRLRLCALAVGGNTTTHAGWVWKGRSSRRGNLGDEIDVEQFDELLVKDATLAAGEATVLLEDRSEVPLLQLAETADHGA